MRHAAMVAVVVNWVVMGVELNSTPAGLQQQQKYSVPLMLLHASYLSTGVAALVQLLSRVAHGGQEQQML
jgi:hypothetical protein